MTDRYKIKPDDATESYKIIDTGTIIGTEDLDHEWVATAYDLAIATHICDLLDANPHTPLNQ